MESVSLYSEARNEYMKQLATWIVPPLVEFFRNQFSEIAAKEGKKAMTHFQAWCSEIPRWNQDIIDSNINKLLDSCRCDYIEELMTAVFIAHTKMLTAIRVSSKQKKLQITLPKLDHFLHRIFVECARSFWKAPFLFLEDLSAIEKQKNVLQAEVMCTESLSSAVRSLLPIKSILRDYLEEDEEHPVPATSIEEHRKKKKRRQPEPEPESESSLSDSSSNSDSDSEHENDKKTKKQEGGKQTEPITQPSIDEPSYINTSSDTKIFESPPIQPLTEKVAEAPVLEKVELDLEPIEAIPVSDTEPPIVSKVEKEIPLSSESKIESNISESSLSNEPIPEINIETEPSVRFSNYETVFYDNKPDVNEIRYAPKLSIEEMPDKPELEPYTTNDWFEDEQNEPNPKIHVNSDSEQALTLDDVEDLEPPKTTELSTDIDVDIPLASESLDFEELA